MNHIVFDTEGTYNIGYVILDADCEKVLCEKQLVISENFNNPKLVGEEMHKVKTRRFTETNAIFCSAVEAITALNKDLKEYQVKYAWAYNLNVDIKSITMIFNQAAPYEKTLTNPIDQLHCCDLAALVKFIYEIKQGENYNLEFFISDKLSRKVTQFHDGLTDAKWCSYILKGVFAPEVYAEAKTIFAQMDIAMSNAIEIASLTIGAQGFSADDAISILNPSDYTVKTLNTRLNKLVEAGFLTKYECPKYGKNGNLLKTTLTKYKRVNDKVILSIATMYLTLEGKENMKKEIKTKLLSHIFSGLSEEQNIDIALIKKALEDEFNLCKQTLEIKYSDAMEKVAKEKIKIKQTAEQDKYILELQYQKKNNQLDREYQEKIQNERQRLDRVLQFLLTSEGKKWFKAYKKGSETTTTLDNIFFN